MSWEQKQLKDVAFVNMGQSPDSNTYNDRKVGLPFLQGCSEFGDIYPTPKVHCSAPLKKAPVQSVLISVRAPVGDLNIADTEYCIGRGLGSIIAENIEKRYLYYNMLKSKSILQQRAQGSTFDAINSKELNELSLYITTDPKEQKKIADILESVDNSIESTQKAIEKYKLVKQGMMQDLLTRGIDESGKLRPTYEEAPELYKPSNFGYIPKEWDEKSVLDVATISSGGTPNRGNALYWDGDIPWVTTGEVNFNTITDTNEKITQEGMNSSAAKLFEKGTILMAMYGQGVTRAKCAILGINATTNQACAAIRTFGINNMFLYHYLRFSYNSLRNLSNDGSQQNLNSVLIGSFPIIKPQNQTEQQRIANRLTSIDNKIEAEQTYLKKLQKIKQGLMQDLLTGKVRCKF